MNALYKALKTSFLLLFFWVSLPFTGLKAQDYKNEKQLIKGANEQFDDKKYKEAIPLFSTLVSNYPKDPTYNYKYGASLLYGSDDKEKPIKYLKFAISRPDVDPIAYFYYAEALHLNYEFDRAIKFYKKFTNNAKNSTIKRNTVDNQIRQCENGKTLLKTITDLIVLDEKKTRVQDFYKVYDLSAQGGQILIKIDEFRSPYELKNDINGLFYFPKNANKIFFSSHTFENTRGKDLFYAERKEDNTWSKPINLGKTINTEFDEDYPYMSSDGITLYFASQGHNSLGGYDIFVSRLDTNTGNWTAPKNLDFAINTPADDYLFIPDASGETAYFASQRETPVGEVSVYQINMERVPLDFTFIYGTFTSETTKNATIKVENVSTNVIVGEYLTSDEGKYKIKLPNDGKFRFLVDYEGSSVTHSGEVDLQDRSTFKPLKQEMLVMGQGTENEKLIIKNLVDEDVEEDVELTAEFFKEKAKLKVNKDKYKNKKPKLTTPVVEPTEAPKKEEPTAIVENREHQGKAASNIAAEKSIDSSIVSNEGPTLTIDETPNANPPSDDSSSEVKNREGAVTENAMDDENQEDPESIDPNGSGLAVGNTADGQNDSGENRAVKETVGNDKNVQVNAPGKAVFDAAAFAAKLKPTTSASKPEIKSALQSNVSVAESSSEMLSIQQESAQNIADRKTIEAAKLKAEADKTLSVMDADSEENKNSAAYKEAQKQLKQAAALEQQAKIANSAATELAQNNTGFERVLQTGQNKTEQMDANSSAIDAGEVSDYSSLLDAEANQSYNIYEERQKAKVAHEKEEKEFQHFSNELTALQYEIEDSKKLIKQKEAALADSRGKEAKQLEEELVQEKAALSAMEQKSEADEQELKVLEEEAKLEEAELAAFDAIISEMEANERYAELSNAPNLIDGAGVITTNRPTKSDVMADNGTASAIENEGSTNEEEINLTEQTSSSSAAMENTSSEQNTNASETTENEGITNSEGMVAQQTTSTSQEEQSIVESNKTEAIAVSVVPSNLSNVTTEVPKTEAKMVLFPDLEEGDSLSAEEQALLPTPENNASAFIPENTLADLSDSDQSIRAQLQSNYHAEYMKEFFEIAEEEEPYTKAVHTYALNQSWLLDVDKEITYLEGIEDEIPDENYQAYQARIATLEDFKETKLNDVESSKETLDAMQPSSDQNAAEIAADFREEMNRVFNGEGRLSEDQLAEELNKAANSNAQPPVNSTEDSDELSAQNSSNPIVSSETDIEGGTESANSAENGVDVIDSETSAESNDASGLDNEMADNTNSTNSTVDALDASGIDAANENAAENVTENASSVNASSVNASESNDAADFASGNSDESEGNSSDFSTGSDSDNEAFEGSTEPNSQTAEVSAQEASSESSMDASNQTDAGTGLENDRLNSEASDGGAINSNSVAGQVNESEQMNTGRSNNVQSNSSAGSVARNNSGEIIPNQKEDKLAEAFNMEGADAVEAIVTNYTDDIDTKESTKRATVEQERAALEEKQEVYNNASKKEKRALVSEIREQEQQIALVEKEAEMLAYKKTTISQAADNVLALEPGDEKPSEKVAKKAETITVKAEEARNTANEKAIEKVRGKKKKRAKLEAVDQLNHEADLLELEANRLSKMSMDLATIESDILAADKMGTKSPALPKAKHTIAQADVQDIAASPEYMDYDEQRKEAVKTYKEAQVLYQEELSLAAQNKVIDAEIQNVTNDMASASDAERKAELNNKLEDLKTSKVENTKLMNQKQRQAKTKYLEYNKKNQAAINTLRSMSGESGEQAVALANLAEVQGVYTLSGSDAPAVTDVNVTTDNLALNSATDATSNGNVNPVEENSNSGNQNESASAQQGTGSNAQNNQVQSSTGYSPEKFNRVVQGIDNYPAELTDAIFKMIDFNESLYSEDNPIPMNNQLPTGLVYKVQIGAFRNPPPQDVYKGFAPVRGENTRPGWIRYTAGLFQDKNQAQLKRNEIRALGYEDAFVVAYLNGERVSLARAKDIETGVEQLPAGTDLAAGETPVVPVSAVTGEVKQLSDINGLMYTVQVGAFRNRVTSNELFGISPLIEYRAGNLYKYGSGIYNDINKANQAKNKIQGLGVGDAFVTAFYNGKRVSMEEAQNLANEGSNFAAEQPVTVNAPSGGNSAGINFRVQVGAYRQEVPVEDAKIILSLSNLGLDTKVDGGMTYYTAGSYGSYAEAKQIQTRVVNQGLDGAFVVAIRNGQKIDLQEAIRLTSP